MAPSRTVGEKQRPLREQVLEEMRRRIISGEYAPGARLTEERLCADFGVSRSPVREALRVMEADGFLERLPRRGAVVARPDVERVADLLAVRSRLESLAARLAAERATSQDVADLRRILEASHTATEAGDLDQVAELNSQLHLRILEVSGIRWLSSIAVPLYLHVQWVFRFTAAERAPHSWREHIAVVEAIAAGDADAAEHTALHHVAAAQDAAMTTVGVDTQG